MELAPKDILQNVLQRAENSKSITVISDTDVRNRIAYICRCASNRAGVRLLMSCLLGKLHRPEVDPRNPYTEIGTPDSFSGRTYDEKYLTNFISEHRLPCNPTTAFLTPTLRNINKPLTMNVVLIGRPRELYAEVLALLDDIACNRIDPMLVFIEVVRVLISIRDEKLFRMASLIEAIKNGEGALPLSSEAIVGLIEQHLACKNSSRLPVLIVSAAYKTVGERIGEKCLSLQSHNAADLQTGCIGDVEVCLLNDNNVVTAYEMKMKMITINDIDVALAKIARAVSKPQNYIFITTDTIEPSVMDYAKKMYEETGGIEIVILDCLSFLKHFLHFFHRSRAAYLTIYQEILLEEPDSAVGQTLKEAFLALRQAAESGE